MRFYVNFFCESMLNIEYIHPFLMFLNWVYWTNFAISLVGNANYLNDNLRSSHLLNYFAKKGPSSQSYGFSSSHAWMWELDSKGNWTPKNWCFWTVVLEKTLESLLDCKEIQSVCPKGNQPWIFTGRTDAEAEAPILWPPVANSWLIGKDPDAEKDWRQKEEGGIRGWDG